MIKNQPFINPILRSVCGNPGTPYFVSVPEFGSLRSGDKSEIAPSQPEDRNHAEVGTFFKGDGMNFVAVLHDNDLTVLSGKNGVSAYSFQILCGISQSEPYRNAGGIPVDASYELIPVIDIHHISRRHGRVRVPVKGIQDLHRISFFVLYDKKAVIQVAEAYDFDFRLIAGLGAVRSPGAPDNLAAG